MADRMLNWLQVCRRLGIGRTYFYRLLKKGELPYVRVGKTRGIRVLESDLLKFVEKKRIL